MSLPGVSSILVVFLLFALTSSIQGFTAPTNRNASVAASTTTRLQGTMVPESDPKQVENILFVECGAYYWIFQVGHPRLFADSLALTLKTHFI